MTDEKRFEERKCNAIAQNEREYGREVRERFGDAAMDGANDRLASMSEEDWKDKEALEEAIVEQLKIAMATGDAHGAKAQRLASMHASWIRMHWADGTYTPAAHKGLARAYLADKRFVDYYDGRAGQGATQFLVDALLVCLGGPAHEAY